ncbi:MAG: PA14 domain-containing protein, partial [Verrucomicrobiota bacterium]
MKKLEKPLFRMGLLAMAGILCATDAWSQTAGMVEVPGLLKMEVWNTLSTSDNSLDNTLLADPRYPASPSAKFWASGFNSRTVYPDDTHDGYGGKISGFIIPPETGVYRFFIYSDDSSRLFLSTDEKPANAAQIAEETGCCNIFTEPDSPRTSEPINLTGGKKYYIEGIWKEGGGGDYMQVAWRKEGDTTPAASLTPISPAFLASMVPASGDVKISKQPANLSVARNDRTSLTVVYSTTNSPVLVQWQRNGVTIAGATGSTLRLGPVQPADNGAKYRAVISTPGAVATSDEAVLTVTPDVTLPKVTGIVASDTFDTVTIDFSEVVSAASAGAKVNYALDGGLSVTAATVESPTRVRLTTSRQSQGAAYNLTVNNVEDSAGNKIAANSKVAFTAFGPIKGGLKL